jgi:glucose-1-phosphate thymidylyltransferase
MHDYVTDTLKKSEKIKARNSGEEMHEVFLGDVIQEAIQRNLEIDNILFTDGKYLDIGTPEDMAKAFQFIQHRDSIKKLGK